ncbi:MAG: hypothetical protein SXA11_01735 [Cyanobacteriota bacterium]|nr:hypothetical protein [Cyanobacteriota bacterium]
MDEYPTGKNDSDRKKSINLAKRSPLALTPRKKSINFARRSRMVRQRQKEINRFLAGARRMEL